MTVDPAVVPGLLLLALELLALAAVGYVVARVALRQSDDPMALAQGLVIGPALWGLIVNFVLHLLPGMAGALATWIILLAGAAALACRTPKALRVSWRVLASIGLASALILWVSLASRQLLSIPDYISLLGPAAFIRAGGWPPVAPWIPDQPLIYHFGMGMLAGLLTPPFGPNLAFVSEVLSAYFWTGFVLAIATTLLRFGNGISVLALSPLVLSRGTWTLVWERRCACRLEIASSGWTSGRGHTRFLGRHILAHDSSLDLGGRRFAFEHLEPGNHHGLCTGPLW